jgi:hypothetical protein
VRRALAASFGIDYRARVEASNVAKGERRAKARSLHRELGDVGLLSGCGIKALIPEDLRQVGVRVSGEKPRRLEVRCVSDNYAAPKLKVCYMNGPAAVSPIVGPNLVRRRVRKRQLYLGGQTNTLNQLSLGKSDIDGVVIGDGLATA